MIKAWEIKIMKFKMIMLKIKRFFKRNAYGFAVGTCAVVALVAITLVAVFSSASQNEVPIKPIETVTPTAIVFTSPIEGAEITKEFANDKLLEDKTTGYWQTHSGIDISASEGTSVLAVFDGTIESVENSMMEGTIITIKHSDSLKSIYKCLSDNNVSFKAGDSVKRGEKIGEVGASLKEKEDGSHLHLEVYENGKAIDPTTYMETEGK